MLLLSIIIWCLSIAFEPSTSEHTTLKIPNRVHNSLSAFSKKKKKTKQKVHWVLPWVMLINWIDIPPHMPYMLPMYVLLLSNNCYLNFRIGRQSSQLIYVSQSCVSCRAFDAGIISIHLKKMLDWYTFLGGRGKLHINICMYSFTHCE